MNIPTGIVIGDIFKEHKTGAFHPEKPERLDAILEGIQKNGIHKELFQIDFGKADVNDIAEIHTREYISRVEESCRCGASFIDSADTAISPKSYEVALYAVGGVISAVDAVVQKKVKNAFCAVRPPGHHAEASLALGFCLFNNVAIAARYIQKKYNLEKILIIDWDVHHGNGTQNAFYSDSSVLYFSIHQSPHYPGSGMQNETGSAEGEGFTINYPVPAGYGDSEYVEIFQRVVVPASHSFKPHFVLISCGFDPHMNDPLSGMRLTEKGFGKLTKIVKKIADEFCEGRLVSILEGGYDYDGISESSAVHIISLLE